MSLPLEVIREAMPIAKNLDDPNPRHPYIELATNFIAFYLMSSTSFFRGSVYYFSISFARFLISTSFLIT